MNHWSHMFLVCPFHLAPSHSTASLFSLVSVSYPFCHVPTHFTLPSFRHLFHRFRISPLLTSSALTQAPPCLPSFFHICYRQARHCTRSVEPVQTSIQDILQQVATTCHAFQLSAVSLNVSSTMVFTTKCTLSANTFLFLLYLHSIFDRPRGHF